MNDGPLAVGVHVILSLLGIFIGTVAVVGHCFAPVPWAYRPIYGAIALALLVQPTMFDGATWVIATGAILGALTLGREFLRGREVKAT